MPRVLGPQSRLLCTLMALTILIAENDESSRLMLTRRLERAGCNVVGVERGSEVQVQVEAVDPDVVLLDIELGDLDGHEVARRLKTDERTWKVPVLALSGHTDPEFIASLWNAGFDEYEPKPINFERLLTKIHRFTQD